MRSTVEDGRIADNNNDNKKEMPNGIKMQILKPGDATNYPKRGQTARIHYVAKLASGAIIDSSRDRKKPICITVGVGQVIEGWDLLLPKMSVGQIVKAIISPEHAYGKEGYPPIVPSNAVLVYEIELMGLGSSEVPTTIATASTTGGSAAATATTTASSNEKTATVGTRGTSSSVSSTSTTTPILALGIDR